MAVCFFDTETTDVPLKTWMGCYIIQLSYLIEQPDGVLIENSFYIKTSVKSTPKAYSIHKISTKTLFEKGFSCKAVLQRFINDLEKYGVTTIISHSIPFDMGFIQMECVRNNIKLDFWKKFTYIDTKKSNKYDFTKGGLSKIVSYDDGREAHDALHDCYLCRELFKISENKEEMISELPPPTQTLTNTYSWKNKGCVLNRL